MSDHVGVDRRRFLEGVATAVVGSLATSTASGSDCSLIELGGVTTAVIQEESGRTNMTGSYGHWLADTVLGPGPASMSFRTGRFHDVAEWRGTARKRVIERMAPVDL